MSIASVPKQTSPGRLDGEVVCCACNQQVKFTAPAYVPDDFSFEPKVSVIKWCPHCETNLTIEVTLGCEPSRLLPMIVSCISKQTLSRSLKPPERGLTVRCKSKRHMPKPQT